jgi:hypothetical protein
MRNSEKGDKHNANNLVASCLDMSCNNLENVRLICSFFVTQAPMICKSTITNWNKYNLYVLVRKVDNEHIYALRYFIANLGTYITK